MARTVGQRSGTVQPQAHKAAGSRVEPWTAAVSTVRAALHLLGGTMPVAHHIVRRRPRRRPRPPHLKGALKPPAWYRRHVRRELRMAAQDVTYVLPVARSRCEHRASQAGDLLVNAIARGVGQVAFANNPVSGAVIFLALCLPLAYTYALLAAIGLVASTGTALWLGLGRTALNNGLFTFNGVLVGQAAATFLVLDTAAQVVAACVAVAVFAAFAALLTQALGNLLVAHHKVPPFTLPFNLATLCLLLFVASTPNADTLKLRDFVIPSPLPLPTDADPTEKYMDTLGLGVFVQTVFRGVAQIWLCDHYVSGIAVVGAIALYSPTSAAMAVLGSLVGACTAMGFGVSSAAIEAGLWGYNGSLGAIAVGGLFYLLTWRTLCLAIVNAVVCTAVQGALAASFRGTGMPVMTLPFCFGTITIVMLRTFQPISLATMTTPEEHSWRFAMLKKQKAAATRAALVTFGNLHAGFVAALEDYERQVMERRGTPAHSIGKRRPSAHPRWRIAIDSGKQHPDRGMPWLSMPMVVARVLLDGRSVFARQFRRSKHYRAAAAPSSSPKSTSSLTRPAADPIARQVSATKLDTLGSSVHDLLYKYQPSLSGGSTTSSNSDIEDVELGNDGALTDGEAPARGGRDGITALEDMRTLPMLALHRGPPPAATGSLAGVRARSPGNFTPLSSIAVDDSRMHMQVEPTQEYKRGDADTKLGPSPQRKAQRAANDGRTMHGAKSAHCLLGELGGDAASMADQRASSTPQSTAPMPAVVIRLDGDDDSPGAARASATRARGGQGKQSPPKKPHAKVVTFKALATGVGLPDDVDGKALVQCLLAPTMGSLGALVARLTLRQGVARRQTGYGHFTGSLSASMSGLVEEL